MQFRYEGANLEGEKRMELTVVPQLALRVTPPIAIVPAGRGASAAVDREVRVTVTNHGKGRRQRRRCGWITRPSWNVDAGQRKPSASRVRTNRRRCDSCCGPARKTALGDYAMRAVAATGCSAVRDGFAGCRVPAYSTPAARRFPPAVAVKVMDVRLAPNLSIGYVMGTGDEVPAALRGLGASVQLLDADALSWADLSRYDAIFIGVRAYDSRPDLRANNKRILDYAAAGGTVIVQYNRGNTWTQYAPFAAGFSNTRVTDENGQVQMLACRRSVVPLSERDRRSGVAELGAGARHVLHRSRRISATPI